MHLYAMRFAAQRDAEALCFAAYAITSDRLRWQHAMEVWQLVPYPVTCGEYAALFALERSRPTMLGDFARYLYQKWDAKEAAAHGWRPEVVAWLEDLEGEAVKDLNDGQREHQTRTLLDAAIARGELPQPTMTPEGLVMPLGLLMDWLQLGGDYRLDGPGFVIPALESLGGDRAQWEIVPDDQAEQVRARREQIACALAGCLQFKRASLPLLHPPATLAEQDAAREQARAGWPNTTDAPREHVEIVGNTHAKIRRQWLALLTILGEIEQEDFCGEDPLPPGIRGLVEVAERAFADTADAWAMACVMANPVGAPTCLPFPPPPVAEVEEELTYLREVFRDIH